VTGGTEPRSHTRPMGHRAPRNRHGRAGARAPGDGGYATSTVKFSWSVAPSWSVTCTVKR
jgi:hypothetical protein